jgi:hypothetical protein
MKSISLIAQKAAARNTSLLATGQSTGAHCPLTGVWQDELGRLRFLTKGALFPTTAKGPSKWRLQEAESSSSLS